ncbi:LysE family translocator [Hyphococcus flavus]|uniref:LysE family translocator n=1 Tax=Hyphococcus flavus TaxID=1866326 RepID=A0AAF0CIL5_9PROT|nr:LysE family translocator [Hyphococcus flavus]WDI32982.1 LysE family translocator [Hyphococcus flavus]
MTIELYLAFVAATALLVLTPGPMVAYIVATTLSHGLRHGLMALIGSAAASAVQLAVVVAGLALILTAAGELFFWIKWVGVAYLVYLGVKALRQPNDELEPALAPQRSGRRTIVEAFVVNLTNPKGLLFHGAFLPLFVSPAAPATPQLVLLAVTFVVVAALLDGCWAVFAARVKPWLARIGRWRHRITGGVMLGAAAGLALVRK